MQEVASLILFEGPRTALRERRVNKRERGEKEKETSTDVLIPTKR